MSTSKLYYICRGVAGLSRLPETDGRHRERRFFWGRNQKHKNRFFHSDKTDEATHLGALTRLPDALPPCAGNPLRPGPRGCSAETPCSRWGRKQTPPSQTGQLAASPPLPFPNSSGKIPLKVAVPWLCYFSLSLQQRSRSELLKFKKRIIGWKLFAPWERAISGHL